ncbi:MAG TPA: HupE/UreJ family protein [Gemmatimonadales bacterium]|nr:HupE/UreJ family protein [Gemmatimonadales bacterium]
MDHLLFLVALAATYQAGRWRDTGWVISAFTVGHSVTLALAATHVVRLPERAVELLIPLTIVATGLHNLRDRTGPSHPGRRSLLAGGFGLVHGAGFASYLERMFDGPVVLPLLGFNLGIELGQIAVLAVIAGVLTLADRVVTLPARATAVSAAVVVAAAGMALGRLPW